MKMCDQFILPGVTLTKRTADQRSSHSKRQPHVSLKEFSTILAGQQLNILLDIS